MPFAPEQLPAMYAGHLNAAMELRAMAARLRHKQPFSFVRFGDGELRLLKGEQVKTPNWFIDAAVQRDFVRQLEASLCYRADDYFIGIPCGCCEYRDHFRALLRERYVLRPEQLSYAALFANANQALFMRELWPLLRRRPLVLALNAAVIPAALRRQNLHLCARIKVPNEAWQQRDALLAELLRCVRRHDSADLVVLIAAGPVANIMIHELHRQHPGPIYLDIGSSLDGMLGLAGSRNHNAWFGWKSQSRCFWGKPEHADQISCDSQSKSRARRFGLKLRAAADRLHRHYEGLC